MQRHLFRSVGERLKCFSMSEDYFFCLLCLLWPRFAFWVDELCATYAVDFTFIPSGSERETNLAVSIRRENWEIKIPLPFPHALPSLIKSSLSHSHEKRDRKFSPFRLRGFVNIAELIERRPH